MHNILVTGADGQLGREMRTLGAASRHRYFFTDVADLDITDANTVRRFVENERIDAIVNCAAYTNVDKAEEEAETADRINHEAVRNLAEAAKACDATLFHISTDYVFGGMGNIPSERRIRPHRWACTAKPSSQGKRRSWLRDANTWFSAPPGSIRPTAEIPENQLQAYGRQTGITGRFRSGGNSDLRRRPGPRDLRPHRIRRLCRTGGLLPLLERRSLLLVRFRP